MVASQASFTFRRYLIKGERPDVSAPEFLDRLRKHAFKPITGMEEDACSVGWITDRHLYDTAFDMDKVSMDGYVRFSLRVDRKRAPARLVKANLAIEERAWCEANDAPRVPFAVRRELRGQVREKVLKETPPNMASHQVLWNVKGRRVYFGGLAGALNAEFTALFQETFGLDLVRLDPMGLANSLCDDAQALGRLVKVAPVSLGLDQRGSVRDGAVSE